MAGSCGKVNREAARFIAVANFAWRTGQGNEDPRMVSFPAPGLTVHGTREAMIQAIRLHDLHFVSKTGGKSGDIHA